MTTSASAAAKEVFDLLRDDLLAIEQEFERDAVSGVEVITEIGNERDAVSGVEVITEIGEYLREGGGKRIRPALLLLAAKLCGYEGRGRCGWVRWLRSFTPPRWSTMTSSTRP